MHGSKAHRRAPHASGFGYGSTGVSNGDQIRERVEADMPRLRTELEDLVRIPSVSGPDQDDAQIRRAYEMLVELFAGAGLQSIRSLDLPASNPILLGEIPAPDGAPTVLLYSHYDVVAAGDESKWDSPPFEPTERGGALFGRGTADTKSNVMVHVGALRAFAGRPPVGIKVVIEGSEESGGDFVDYPPTDPELFACDAIVIADAGAVRPGVPTLTVALRGTTKIVIEAETLDSPKHSGQFGGAAPDALLAVIHAIASLHDSNGDVAVPGLRREPWSGESYTEQELRELAGVDAGQPLVGTGDIGSRVWSGPAITVTGMDVVPVRDAVNAIPARARASLDVRFHPEQDAQEAQRLVIDFLAAQRPFGIKLEASAGMVGTGFAAQSEAWESAYGTPPVFAATGGSIPLVNALAAAAPEAEVLLIGACDDYANIHGPNERLLLDEFERTVIAEAEFFARLAARGR
jgi:acetylornithine deacetylase/succinyl-diaminopimelate desuccinylase-like protein